MSAGRLVSFIPLAALIVLVLVGGALLLGGRQDFKFQGVQARPMPAFELPQLNADETLTSDALVGRRYLVNVFASWCVPCRAEHPLLMDMHKQGVQILGVAYKDDPADTSVFIRRLGDPYVAIVVDRDGAFALQLGVTGAPETFVIDEQGRIIATYRGPLTEDALSDVVMPALRGD